MDEETIARGVAEGNRREYERREMRRRWMLIAMVPCFVVVAQGFFSMNLLLMAIGVVAYGLATGMIMRHYDK